MAASVCPLRAEQASPSDDPVMLMNRAIVSYNADKPEAYEACVRDLTQLLEMTPEDSAARFLRILAYGQLAWRQEDKDWPAAAKHYLAMQGDLDRLLARLTDDFAIAQLINGVVLTKLAGYTGGTHDERIAARARLLPQARQALERYLRPPADSGLSAPEGLNRVRGEFFLAVVTYRLSLEPGTKEGEPDQLADRATLDRAAEMMAALADRPHLEELLPPDLPSRESELQRWLSYPHFYLGLIRTRQGNDDAKQREYSGAKQHWQQAVDDFETAKQLDRFQDQSLSLDLIPKVAEDQIAGIQEAEKSLAKPAEPAENIFVDWRLGFAYDRNVILLGRDTEAPVEIGRKKDERFGTGVVLGYTLDLAKLDEALDRWTLGLLGRASSSWHDDIHEFNEQDYGASAAITYELWRPRPDQRHGPLYVGLQYDYDYYLLGNDGFLRTNRISPRLTLFTFDQRGATTFSFAYEDRNYLEPLTDRDFDRDGNYFEFRLSQSFDLVDMTALYKSMGIDPWGWANDPVDPAKFSPDDLAHDTRGYRRWLQPYVEIEYGWDATKGKEFDDDHILLAAGFVLPLPYGLRFDFGGEWEWQDYNHPSNVDYHREVREDFVQRYGFGLERRFVLVPGQRNNRRTVTIDRATMTVRGDIRFTDDHANIEDRLGQSIFSYRRAVYGLSVLFQFD